MDLPKHIPQLDVLRGIAVLTVMLYHALDIVPNLHLRPILNSGYVGVDLFFVLSGFLITGILVRTRESRGYFVNFYSRRALRIWPLYYVLLFFTFVLLPLIHPQARAAVFGQSRPWQAFPFFLQNLTLSGQAFDTLRVTWSLAIEEQFYLVWPLIVFLAPPRMLKSLALTALFLSIATRWAVQYGLVPPVNIYTNTLTRLDGLALGALLALWIPEASDRTVKLLGISILALTLPVTLVVGWYRSGHWIFYALVSLCFASLLCTVIDINAFSRLRFLSYSGKISYALYLVHVPVFTFVGLPEFRRFAVNRSTLGNLVLLLVSLAICYAFAAASWHLFERKFLKLKDRFEYAPGPTLTAFKTS
jgi:peptidoglycan/LPS O-acetylase OafA/YrhL